jgi:ArsR family transcriptional regulator
MMNIIKVMSALSNETRYMLMVGLKKRSFQTCCERIEVYENGISVGDAVEVTGLAQSTISQHLKVLEEADLIRREKRGPWTCFFMNENTLKDFMSQIIRDF